MGFSLFKRIFSHVTELADRQAGLGGADACGKVYFRIPAYIFLKSLPHFTGQFDLRQPWADQKEIVATGKYGVGLGVFGLTKPRQ